jgi:glycosyltransferase involved in cell wall biosynthesis
MKIFHLIMSGGVGGIEVLCRDIGLNDHENENIFCFLCGEGALFQEMKTDGLHVVSLAKIGNHKISFQKLKCLEKLVRDADIIVSHHDTVHNYFYFWRLKRAFPNKKYMLVGHSCYDMAYIYPNSFIKRSLYIGLIRKALFAANRICFVSEAGRRSYMKAFPFLNVKKTSVVYNGISEKILAKGQDSEPAACIPIEILYIGRLVKTKGVNILLEAVAQLKNSYPIHLTIVGDGDARESLEAQTDELNIGTMVSFEGMQRDKDLYYRKASIFVYPSIWQEVFGISIVEAMAYGIPCVANRVGGIPEIISDNENGYLTAESTPTGIADAIERAITAFRNCVIGEISLQGKVTAQRFDVRNTVRGFQNIYHSFNSIS